MEHKPDLAIILPIYNPHKSWEIELENHINDLLNKIGNDSVNFILVNDGSSIDFSKEIEYLKLKFNNLKYISYKKNKGKGNAIRVGLKETDAKHYIYLDWDFPFGTNSVIKINDILKQNQIDLVISNRSLNYYNALPLSRKVLSKSLKFFSFFYLGFKKYDTQTGLKGLSEKGHNLFLKTKINSFIFELEFVKLAITNKLPIKSIIVDPAPSIKFTSFKFQVIKNEITSLIKILFNGK